MVETKKITQGKEYSDLPQRKREKHSTLIENTWKNNKNSDYTEKITKLQKNFNYQSNSHYYWTEPEFSLLYGTPFYEAASSSQKLVLNHLYWIILYYGTASSEANTILYNQITAGVFETVGGCETLCQELDLETAQEQHHIRAFYKVGRETSMALLGTKVLSKFLSQNSDNTTVYRPSSLPQRQNLFQMNWDNSPLREYEERAIKFITKTMLKKQERFYSRHFQKLDKQGKTISVPMSGWNGRIVPAPMVQFFHLNYGSSPFLACSCYLVRFMANVLQKNQEYRHSHYLQELQKKGETIPSPTAISHYHFLDESFHITTSQTLAKDWYKEFSKPSAYEKCVANITAYLLQKMVNLSNGVSSGMHGNYFGSDYLFMFFIYKLLQTPIFNMSSPEALYWMEKSLCQEHEGFHLTLKLHQKLAKSLRCVASELDYLWPVNREMCLLDSGISIDNAIQTNVKTFQQLSKSLTN